MSLPGVCVVYPMRRTTMGMQVLLGVRRAEEGLPEVVGIGGPLAPGEPAPEAAAREARRRIGVRIEASRLRHAGTIEHHYPTRPAWSQQSTVFVCRRWHGEPRELDGLTPRWFALEAVPYARMRADESRWLPGVLRGGTADARFTFGADLATVVLTAH